jgi:hypothetical protein
MSDSHVSTQGVALSEVVIDVVPPASASCELHDETREFFSLFLHQFIEFDLLVQQM